MQKFPIMLHMCNLNARTVCASDCSLSLHNPSEAPLVACYAKNQTACK